VYCISNRSVRMNGDARDAQSCAQLTRFDHGDQIAGSVSILGASQH